MTEHQGLPVAGYRPQNEVNVAIVNVNKQLEERCLRQIDKLARENADHAVTMGVVDPPYDARMIALARTGIQDAFMWLNRAVFQPARVSLPEDVP